MINLFRKKMLQEQQNEDQNEVSKKEEKMEVVPDKESDEKNKSNPSKDSEGK